MTNDDCPIDLCLLEALPAIRVTFIVLRAADRRPFTLLYEQAEVFQLLLVDYLRLRSGFGPDPNVHHCPTNPLPFGMVRTGPPLAPEEVGPADRKATLGKGQTWFPSPRLR